MSAWRTASWSSPRRTDERAVRRGACPGHQPEIPVPAPAVSDPFAGAWLVTEYVHDPDGRLAGIVRQRRTLEATAPGVIRVTQVCEPEGLDGHPMQDFAGTWVFDLRTDGARRIYEGPDVVGHGYEWSPGAMTGRGVWPRFGHTFESFAVLVAPDRQLTGGFFGLAGRPVADIVGVAEPDRGRWPELDLSAAPSPPAAVGPGVEHRMGPLAVAEHWPSPTEQVRTLAIADPLGGASVTIADRRTPDGRRVDIRLDRPGLAGHTRAR